MNQPADATSPFLEYAPSRSRRLWKRYLLSLVTAPLAYILLYVALRMMGILSAYFSQGRWEIEGGTGAYIIDVAFYPMVLIEGDIQNKLRWLPEPSGG